MKTESKDKTKITRIKASTTQEIGTTKKSQTKVKKPTENDTKIGGKLERKKANKNKKPNVFRRFGSYLKGSFSEIKLVKWPSRKETWSMTFAVLAYGALIVVIVLLLDALYSWLFKLIIK